MAEVVRSVNSVPIRLTDERWTHIVETRDELSGRQEDVLRTIADPDVILAGHEGELKAARQIGPQRQLIVVYRELGPSDGFIITAYETTKRLKGAVLWRKPR